MFLKKFTKSRESLGPISPPFRRPCSIELENVASGEFLNWWAVQTNCLYRKIMPYLTEHRYTQKPFVTTLLPGVKLLLNANWMHWVRKFNEHRYGQHLQNWNITAKPVFNRSVIAMSIWRSFGAAFPKSKSHERNVNTVWQPSAYPLSRANVSIEYN